MVLWFGSIDERHQKKKIDAEGIGSEKGYTVGRLSLLVDDKGRKSKGINNGIHAN